MQTPEVLEAEVRVASPVEMSELIRDARKQGFNRQINEDVIKKLDGYSFVIPMLIHEHKEGVLTEPHYRCRVLLRFKENPTIPHESWLDLQISNFNSLRTVSQVRQPVEEPEAVKTTPTQTS